MEYVAITILSVAAIVFALYPMLSRQRYLYEIEDVFTSGNVRELNYLNNKKELVFSNLKELDFEYEMGKLAEDDYNRLRNDYLHEAEETVQAIDNLKVREEIENLIERDVSARRRTE